MGVKGSEVCKHFWLRIFDKANDRYHHKTVPELVKLANENLPEASKWWFLDQVRPKAGKKWTRAYQISDLANAAYPEAVTYSPGLSDDWKDYKMQVPFSLTPKASAWDPLAIRNSRHDDCPLCKPSGDQ